MYINQPFFRQPTVFVHAHHVQKTTCGGIVIKYAVKLVRPHAMTLPFLVPMMIVQQPQTMLVHSRTTMMMLRDSLLGVAVCGRLVQTALLLSLVALSMPTAL